MKSSEDYKSHFEGEKKVLSSFFLSNPFLENCQVHHYYQLIGTLEGFKDFL